jgi:hypothetical protein
VAQLYLEAIVRQDLRSSVGPFDGQYGLPGYIILDADGFGLF